MQEEVSAELMLKSAIPIDDIDQLITGPDDGLAIVWVDISERPDLQILAEQHQGEQGYCVLTFYYGNQGKHNMLILLRMEMRKPTRAVFHLAFKVAQYPEQLRTIGKYGKMWIVPGPPPAHLVGTQAMTFKDLREKVIAYCGAGLQIELEPHLRVELAEQLATWKGR